MAHPQQQQQQQPPAELYVLSTDGPDLEDRLLYLPDERTALNHMIRYVVLNDLSRVACVTAYRLDPGTTSFRQTGSFELPATPSLVAAIEHLSKAAVLDKPKLLCSFIKSVPAALPPVPEEHAF
jgi:hypothetical protein